DVGELVDARLELVDHLAERDDIQHTLAVTDDVHEVLARADEHRVRAVENEARRCPIVAEVATDVLDRPPCRLQLHARVEEVLDHLETYEVPVRVPPLGAAPPRVRQGRANEVGAGPVIELAVGDAHDLADLRPAEADLVSALPARQRRVQRPLLERRDAAVACCPARRPRARLPWGVFGGAHATDDLARRRTTRPPRPPPGPPVPPPYLPPWH